MAVVPVLLNLGQSNAGPQPDFESWAVVNGGLNITLNELSSPHFTGGYDDLWDMPGTWPSRLQKAALKGSAVQSLRYLTFFNPVATGLGYTQYPHKAVVQDIIAQTSLATSLQIDKVWQYDPTGRTVYRSRTGTTHTIDVWGGPPIGSAVTANQIIVSPAFDPPPTLGEQIEYRLYSGANSADKSTVLLDMRYGGNYGDGTWRGSLAGLRLRAISGQNSGDSRNIDTLTLNASVIVELSVTEQWQHIPQAGDEYVCEPIPLPSGASVPFRKFGLFLPWSPLEGEALEAGRAVSQVADTGIAGTSAIGFDNSGLGASVVGDFVQFTAAAGQPTDYNGMHKVLAATTLGVVIGVTFTSTATGTIYRVGKKNPYPPGFSFPNHHDQPPIYQPFRAPSIMFGLGSKYGTPRAAFHITMANRLQERLGKTIYVASCAIGGATMAHNELSPVSTIDAVGWFDPRQQNYWTPGEDNAAWARVLDVLDTINEALSLEGHTGEIVAVTFPQGESDAGSLEGAAKYAAGIKGFKAQLRQAIKARNLFAGDAEDIPFLQPKVRNFSPWVYASTVNAAIQQETVEDIKSATCEVDDLAVLTELPASVHYTGTAATTLANRLFAAWEAITYRGDEYEDAIVAEDGTGLSTANSYVTQSFVNTYLANAGNNATWTAATQKQRDVAMMQATQWIDMVYGTRFAGYRSSNTQALEFPRSLAYDAQGYAIEGIPLALKRATAEMARRWLEDASQFNPDVAAGSNVTQDTVSVGPISISKTYAGGKDGERRFKIVDRLFQVAGLIDTGGWAKR